VGSNRAGCEIWLIDGLNGAATSDQCRWTESVADDVLSGSGEGWQWQSAAVGSNSAVCCDLDVRLGFIGEEGCCLVAHLGGISIPVHG
jgi:hypothetical protein